jgi:hypothetical protein
MDGKWEMEENGSAKLQMCECECKSRRPIVVKLKGEDKIIIATSNPSPSRPTPFFLWFAYSFAAFIRAGGEEEKREEERGNACSQISAENCAFWASFLDTKMTKYDRLER